MGSNVIPAIVSADNSSTTLLANAAVFTGTAEEVTEYSSVVATILSSHAGTMLMEFSPDGTNYDISISVPVVASVTKSQSVPIMGKFYRTKFTNSGGSTQTVMRLQTILSHQTAQVLSATDAILSGSGIVTPKFAVIDAATSGDNTLVAAVTGKKIRVLGAFMVAAGAVNARFESGAGGTAMSGQMNLTTNSGFVLPYSPVGWGETAAAALLNLELSAAVSVDGMLIYAEI